MRITEAWEHRQANIHRGIHTGKGVATGLGYDTRNIERNRVELTVACLFLVHIYSRYEG